MSNLTLQLKRGLIGTPLGRMAANAKDLVQLLRTPRVALGTTVNDQLAGALVVRLCRPGQAFLDIGAHIGSVTAETLRHCPTARVICFEAIPEKAAWLRSKFPSVEVHEVALFEEEGEVSFFVDPRYSGYSSLAAGRDKVVEIRVLGRRLDSVVKRDDVDVIKLDVEGAELGVLRGATDLVDRCRPIIMYESGPADALGFTKQAMYAWFQNRDYQIFAPNRLAGTGGPIDLSGYLDSHEYPRRTTNYFAVPRERCDETRERVRSFIL